MTQQKGPKKLKMAFTVKQVKRKKTRQLTGSALVETIAKIIAAKRDSAAPAKA